MAQFFTLLTEIGQAKLANAIALGQTIEITHLAVGDGGGILPTPQGDEDQLINERRRASINTSHVDPDNPNWIVVEQVIPPDVGGWTIREVGIIDSAGDLIGYGNYPETYKPVLEEGSSRTQTVRFVLEVSDTAAVTLKIDPSVVLATRKYVDDQRQAHEESRNHPAATTNEQGMVQLASSEQTRDGTATNRGTHPAGVRSAIEYVMARPGTVNVANINGSGVLSLTRDMGRYLTLQGHGAASHEISGFGSQCPVGWEVTLLIPRTAPNTGGTANALGNYVQFLHTASGEGLDLTLNARQEGSSTLYTYQAYPNANDALGNRAALHEQLTFVHEGNGRWRLVALPEDAYGVNSNGRWWKSALGLAAASVQTVINLTTNHLTENSRSLAISMVGKTHSATWASAASISSASRDSLSRIFVDSPEDNANSVRIICQSPNTNADTDLPARMGITGRWKPNV